MDKSWRAVYAGLRGKDLISPVNDRTTEMLHWFLGSWLCGGRPAGFTCYLETPWSPPCTGATGATLEGLLPGSPAHSSAHFSLLVTGPGADAVPEFSSSFSSGGLGVSAPSHTVDC